MKVTYTGDPRDNFSGPDPLVYNGISFPKGKAVDVDDEVGAKLVNNSHFETKAPKADPNNKRSAADASGGKGKGADVEASPKGNLGSTTGDPETATREQLVSISEQGREPTDPAGEPG